MLPISNRCLRILYSRAALPASPRASQVQGLHLVFSGRMAFEAKLAARKYRDSQFASHAAKITKADKTASAAAIFRAQAKKPDIDPSLTGPTAAAPNEGGVADLLQE